MRSLPSGLYSFASLKLLHCLLVSEWERVTEKPAEALTLCELGSDEQVGSSSGGTGGDMSQGTLSPSPAAREALHAWPLCSSAHSIPCKAGRDGTGQSVAPW